MKSAIGVSKTLTVNPKSVLRLAQENTIKSVKRRAIRTLYCLKRKRELIKGEIQSQKLKLNLEKKRSKMTMRMALIFFFETV